MAYLFIGAIGAIVFMGYWYGISKVFHARQTIVHGEVPDLSVALPPALAVNMKLEFRESALFTPEARTLIQTQYGNFKEYLVSLNIPVPDLPPIGIGQKQGTLVTSPLDKPLYQTSYLIGKQDLNDPYALTEGYATYVVQTSLPTIKKKDKFPFAEQNVRLWIVGLTISTYIHWSFWDRTKPNHFPPGILALWDMRNEFGKPFTDRLVATVFKLMIDDPDEGAQQLTNDANNPRMTKDCEVYLYRKLDAADDLVEGEGTANAHGPNWPKIVNIWKRHNLSTEPKTKIQPNRH